MTQTGDRIHESSGQVMKRLILKCHLILFVFGATTALGSAPCPNMQRPFPAPASEVVEVISGWFSSQGYTVRRDYPRPGVVHLSVWNAQDNWEITVRPQSALASVAMIVHDNAGDSGVTCRRLREYVDEYLTGTPANSPAPTANQSQAFPTAVLDHTEKVVCIQGRSENGSVQFSGFVVDPAGLVLCTAHDLTGRQRVTLTFHDGTSAPGEVIQLDLHRDLALIECPAGDWGFVPLTSGKNLLRMGESVFSIGCPNSLRGTLATGTINGPPRRVKDQPFWQVNMNIHPGSSGSPVFDARGRLVAIVKGRYRGTSHVGFLIPLETIYAFLLNHDE